MDLIADILLGAGAFGAGAWCLALSRRLAALQRLEGGMGGAIAVMSAQVDDLSRALAAARSAAGESVAALSERTAQAEAAAERLELLLASMHDLPDPAAAPAPPAPARLRVLRRRLRPAPLEAAE
ncbi:DUF6468 domain-containing protein [Frigidibacter oleivorans]|uniref:DUF6468 domain-containing protein n=1 Tax=Frigidibacter oleivorans TaxID=2487129 RepID=UPI000F8DF5C0|nr:DUF6468 domain-containing protein [Frigidibacter oleivorans]